MSLTKKAAQTDAKVNTTFYALSNDLATVLKVFDQPKQVRDICKILLTKGELSEKQLIEEMDNGGIKTRQTSERILYYYLKPLTHEVGVTVSTKTTK